MTTLVKLIIGFCLLYMTAYNEQENSDEYEPLAHIISSPKGNVKAKAFEILTTKCNICHEKRNQRRVFTEDNMNDWSTEVYKQVFIKKRMPKGKKIKLTSDEYQDLLTWISFLKNN